MNSSAVTISAVGDVMLGDSPIMVGLGLRSKIEKNNYTSIFESVQPILNKADICFGNLECVLADSNNRPNNLVSNQMRGKPENGALLEYAGFNIMSVANNHIMQHGFNSFYETLKVLDYYKIKPVGIADYKNECIPVFRSVKGLTFCFLAYSLIPEKYCGQVLYAKNQITSIISQLIQLRKECDVIVLSLHWGDEFINIPSKEQIEKAHLLIDSGASIILGHHSHTLQGIENYKHGVIAYSLGNFVFDFFQHRLRKSIIMNLEVTSEKIDYKVYPVYITKDFIPVISKRNFADRQLHKMQKLSSKINRVSEKEIYFYKLKLKFNNILVKIENRIFFVLNFFKYPGTIACQSLVIFFRNRLRDKR